MAPKFGSITVLQQPTTPVDATDSRYHGLKPSSTIQLRDGIKIRADVFRPEGDAKVPALLAWSPYGKTGSGFFNLDLIPGRVGVPKSMLSGYEKFEAVDPAEWVGKGYGIVNIDARGVFDSEGDIRWFGTGEGRDGYDAIEEIAKMPWCNGSVALVGNSWLAMAQWLIAAEKPPHLKCIAPFEGASDFYRETLARGGVPYRPFWGFLGSKLYGRNQQESVLGMIAQYPFMNEYWEDKRARIEDIEVPAYVLASYSTGLHTLGSFRGFEDIKHKKKWLRVHPTQEWHDLYQKETINDLQLFLDKYTKGLDNGWEKTPSVRVSMVNFTSSPVVNQVFPDWPVPSTNYKTLYLGPLNQLSTTKAIASSSNSYKADVSALQVDNDSEELTFSYTVTKKSHLVGYPRLVLYMSGEATDLDVFVQLRKADATGKLLQNINIPLAEMGVSSAAEVEPVNPNIYLGPNGILRASRRAIDQKRSKSHWAVHSHTQETEQKVKPGEVVRMEIGLWPTGIVFEAGEKLVLKVAGHPLILAEFEPLRGAFVAENQGRHTVHFGGEHDSHVVIPLVEV